MKLIARLSPPPEPVTLDWDGVHWRACRRHSVAWPAIVDHVYPVTTPPILIERGFTAIDNPAIQEDPLASCPRCSAD
jgi:hypothetical protein